MRSRRHNQHWWSCMWKWSTFSFFMQTFFSSNVSSPDVLGYVDCVGTWLVLLVGVWEEVEGIWFLGVWVMNVSIWVGEQFGSIRNHGLVNSVGCQETGMFVSQSGCGCHDVPHPVDLLVLQAVSICCPVWILSDLMYHGRGCLSSLQIYYHGMSSQHSLSSCLHS